VNNFTSWSNPISKTTSTKNNWLIYFPSSGWWITPNSCYLQQVVLFLTDRTTLAYDKSLIDRTTLAYGNFNWLFISLQQHDLFPTE